MIRRILMLIPQYRAIFLQMSQSIGQVARTITERDEWKAAYDHMVKHVEWQREQLDNERQERRWLQDRLLERVHAAPIYSASPGQADQLLRMDNTVTPPVSPRAKVIAEMEERQRAMKVDVREQVKEYLARGCGDGSDNGGSNDSGK